MMSFRRFVITVCFYVYVTFYVHMIFDRKICEEVGGGLLWHPPSAEDIEM